MSVQLKLPQPYTPVKLPESILCNQSCKQIAKSFAYSFTNVAVNELTVFRNGESCQVIKRIVAEPGYLLLAIGGTLETLVRAVCDIVLLPVLGIIYFIGRFCCCNKLKNLAAHGMKRIAASVYVSGIATADAAVCLVTNISKGPIPVKLFQKAFPPREEELELL